MNLKKITKEMSAYLTSVGKLEMASLLNLNTNGFHSLVFADAPVGLDVQENGSCIFTLFLPGMVHPFLKPCLDSPLEHIGRVR